MIPGVYRAAASMLRSLTQQDVRAHNLANANTAGFKATLADALDATGGAGAMDMRQGDIRPTGNPLDVALRGDGFFVVDGAAGRKYTRNGRFGADSQGFLVSQDGERVQGTRGAIQIKGSRVEVAQDGTVHVDGKLVDRLLVVQFPARAQLSHGEASGVVGSVQPTQVASVSVEPGAIEDSNVVPMLEVTGMTTGLRVYEANSAVISQIDQSLSRLIQAATG